MDRHWAEAPARYLAGGGKCARGSNKREAVVGNVNRRARRRKQALAEAANDIAALDGAAKRCDPTLTILQFTGVGAAAARLHDRKLLRIEQQAVATSRWKPGGGRDWAKSSHG